MRYGVREICNVVLRAKQKMVVGSKTFYKDEPVLYFDSLTTSSLEGAATTVYAQGGRGNARLLAWEGERTLTFNMTDALISPESFSVLSGADVIDAADSQMYVHATSRAVVNKVNIKLPEDSAKADHFLVFVPGHAAWSHKAGMAQSAGTPTAEDPIVSLSLDDYKSGADIFLMKANGNDLSEPMIPLDKGVYFFLDVDGQYGSHKKGEIYTAIECYGGYIGNDKSTDQTTGEILHDTKLYEGDTVLVDYYTIEKKGKQIEITPDKFGGYFYLEASTLWRDEDTGDDKAAEFVIPRCKVQSNFTFTMAATGDPSTFDFVLDAFPDYSKFDTTKKVLAILQVVEDAAEGEAELERYHYAKPGTLPTTSGENEHRTMYANRADTYPATGDDVASF